MAGKTKTAGKAGKLKVNKQTAKDLSVGGAKAKNVKGGMIARGGLACVSSDSSKTCKCCGMG